MSSGDLSSLGGGRGFGPGAVVWAKIRTHPLWPGLLIHAKDAPDQLPPPTSRSLKLIKFFGSPPSYYWVEPADLVPFEDGEAKHKSGVSKKADKALKEAKEFLAQRESSRPAASPKSPSGSKSTKDKTTTPGKSSPRASRGTEKPATDVQSPASDQNGSEEAIKSSRKQNLATAALDRPQRRLSGSASPPPAALERRKSVESSSKTSEKAKSGRKRRFDVSESSESDESDEIFTAPISVSAPAKSPRTRKSSIQKEEISKPEEEASDSAEEAREAKLTATQEISVSEIPETIAQRRPKRAVSNTPVSSKEPEVKRKSVGSTPSRASRGSAEIDAEATKADKSEENNEELHSTTEHPSSTPAVVAAVEPEQTRSSKRKRSSIGEIQEKVDIPQDDEKQKQQEIEKAADVAPSRPKRTKYRESQEDTTSQTKDSADQLPVATEKATERDSKMADDKMNVDGVAPETETVAETKDDDAMDATESTSATTTTTSSRGRGGQRQARSARGRRTPTRGKRTASNVDTAAEETAEPHDTQPNSITHEESMKVESLSNMSVDRKEVDDASQPSVKVSDASITTSGDVDAKSSGAPTMEVEMEKTPRILGDEILDTMTDPVSVVDTAVDQVMSAISDNDIDGAIGLLSLFDPEASLNGDGKSRLAQILRSVTTETLDLSRLPRLSNELRFHTDPAVKSLSAKLYHRYRTMFEEEYQAHLAQQQARSV